MKPHSFFSKNIQTQKSKDKALLDSYWSHLPEQLLVELHATPNGILQTEAETWIKQYGVNALKAQQQTMYTAIEPVQKSARIDLNFCGNHLCLCGRVDGCQHRAGRGDRQRDVRICAGISRQQCCQPIALPGNHQNKCFA